MEAEYRSSGRSLSFRILGISISDLSLRSMDFGFEFSFVDLGFYELDLRFAKLDVRNCR